jgi:hypothetical protein
LERARPDVDALLLVELPVVLENAGLESIENRVGVLVEALARLGHLAAKSFELDAREPASEPEDHTPIRHVVEDGNLFDYAHGIVPRQHDDHLSELHALGTPGHVGEELHRVRAHVVVGEVMLGGPHRIEAERLGQIRHRELVAVGLAIGVRAVEPLEERAHSNLHLSSSPRSMRARRISCLRL